MRKTIDCIIKGYVVSLFDLKENDQLVTIFTNDGQKYTFLARGIKKISSKNRASCQLFAYSEFEILQRQENGYLSLKRGVLIESLFQSNDDFLRVATYHFLKDLIFKSYDSIDDALTFFKIVDNSLKLLKEKNCNCYFVLSYILMQTLSLIGLSLSLNECVECSSKKQIVSFDGIKGGLVCLNCSSIAQDFSIEQLQSLRKMQTLDIVKLKEISQQFDYSLIFFELLKTNESYGSFSLNFIDV